MSVEYLRSRFCVSHDVINKLKEATELQRISAHNISDKILISNIYEKFLQLNNRNNHIRSSCRGSEEMDLTSIHEDRGLISGLIQWVKDLVLP